MVVTHLFRSSNLFEFVYCIVCWQNIFNIRFRESLNSRAKDSYCADLFLERQPRSLLDFLGRFVTGMTLEMKEKKERLQLLSLFSQAFKITRTAGAALLPL